MRPTFVCDQPSAPPTVVWVKLPVVRTLPNSSPRTWCDLRASLAARRSVALVLPSREHADRSLTDTCPWRRRGRRLANHADVAYGSRRTMIIDELLDRGRTAYDRMAWREAHATLSEADRAGPLGLDDLERLSIVGFMLGRDAEAVDILARCHRAALEQRNEVRAARAAFWLGFSLFSRGDIARAGGWLARAERLLEGRPESVERGFLLLPVAIRGLEEGDWSTSYAAFDEAGAIGERFEDADLTTFARLGRGQALIGMGATARGLRMLDEAMVAVTSGEVTSFVAGIVYCAVIEACHRLFDLRRAQEWTAALDRWVEAQPDLVLFRGECLVYRAELLLLHSKWPAAGDEARRAHAYLIGPPIEPAAGDAVYQQAELHRLTGRSTDAEAAYREASRLGRQPEPGLALLRLAQGRVEAATAMLQRSLDEAQDPLARPRLLAAMVEVRLAAGDVDGAASAAAELAGIADHAGAPLLVALAAHAEGAVRVARGDARAALGVLRRAAAAWNALDAPYQAARIRVLVGLACRALDDEETARLELDAAAQVFRELGALPDLALIGAMTRPAEGSTPGRLTGREVEVLRLVATGKSNRAIGEHLFISEKTVARHMSNIFTKLGLSSRAAATAYAYQHDLIGPPT